MITLLAMSHIPQIMRQMHMVTREQNISNNMASINLRMTNIIMHYISYKGRTYPSTEG